MAEAYVNVLWFYGLQALAIVLPAALFVWAWNWDRAKGAFRCRRCFYSLGERGAPLPALPLTCPECGLVASKKRHLTAPRKCTWLLRAVVVLVLLEVWWYPVYAYRRDFVWFVPTSAMFRVYALIGGAPSTWLYQACAGRAMAEAKENPDRVSEFLTSSVPSDVSDWVRGPARWVRGEPVPIRVGIGAFFPHPIGTLTRGDFRVALPDATLSSAVLSPFRGRADGLSETASWETLFLPAMNPGVATDRLKYEFVLQASTVSEGAQSKVHQVRGTFCASMPDLVDSFEELIPTAVEPIGMAAIKALKLKAFSASLLGTLAADDKIKNVSLGIRIEIRRGALLVAFAEGFVMPDPLGHPSAMPLTLLHPEAFRSENDFGLEVWEVRVESVDRWSAIGADFGLTSAWRGRHQLNPAVAKQLAMDIAKEIAWRQRLEGGDASGR